MTKGSRTRILKKPAAKPTPPAAPQHPWGDNGVVTFNIPVDGKLCHLMDVRFHTFDERQRYALIADITASIQKVVNPAFAKPPKKKAVKK